MRSRFQQVGLVLCMMLATGSPARADARNAVGLSLWFEDGKVRFEDGSEKAVTLYEDFPRYVQELDITASVETSSDQGITPITKTGDMSDLDWRGIELVEEDYRPEFGGGFTRSRFYRGARWMEQSSAFAVLPIDKRGLPVGPPILELAGRDAGQHASDDGFVRRFVARQVTPGCRAVGDCSNAVRFLAQGLAQIRGALHPRRRAQAISRRATALQILWTEDLGHPRTVSIERGSFASTPYRYGFAPVVTVANPPANASFYQPGETIAIKVTLKDGAGNRLHPDGSLPTYADFLHHDIASGIRYYDGLRQLLTPYYALKHREGLSIVTFGGPTHKLRYSDHEVGFNDLFFNPQTTTATVAENGFTGLFQLNPPIQNQALPELQSAPVSDTVPFVIPADAEAGTYVIAVKARRDWGGEALNATATTQIQVGQLAPTGFSPSTGKCNTCHADESGLDKVLHGTADRRTCYSCHSPLAFEPDHALDYRIHLIHSRSKRVNADVHDCSTCHLTQPSGPARGFEE